MEKIRLNISLSLITVGICLVSACENNDGLVDADVSANVKLASIKKSNRLVPSIDTENTGGWVLNTDVSDEFDGNTLDADKWFVEGENGDYYIWKGRAPSQFAPHNVAVEDGVLKLTSRWEPEYQFATSEGHEGNTYGVHDGESVPVTTAAVVSKKRFLNGYMEVRSKAANASMTSSFWAIGYQQELDVYEQIGRPSAEGDIDIKSNTLKASIHDWQPPAKRPTRKFGHKTTLPFDVADEFHVYGAEWGEDYLKFYLDGELIHEITQEEVGQNWVLTNPMEIWFDSEIFVWLGLPSKDELPAVYEIDYLRVWQKPQSNLLDRAFYGFEGPILFESEKRPLDLVPENSENNKYQQFWSFDTQSQKSFQRVRNEKFAKGTWSLKYKGGENTQAQVNGPQGSINLDSGEYQLSVKVWLEPSATAESLAFRLNNLPTSVATFQLDGLERGKWIELKQSFSYSETTADDSMIIAIADSAAGEGALYIDDIAIEHRESAAAANE